MRKRIMRISGICMAAAGVAWMLFVFYGYRQGQEAYQKLREQVICCDTQASEGRDTPVDQDGSKSIRVLQTVQDMDQEAEALPEDAPARITVDWKALLHVNDDIAAWLVIPAIELSYPVLQAEDNDYYLHRGVDKISLYAGSIFMDWQNSRDFEDTNTILYGHNMRDGSMFAGLKQLEDVSTFTMCPYFWIFTREKDILYQICSIHKDTPDGISYQIDFSNAGKRQEWMQAISKMSDADMGMGTKLQENSRIVSLATCTDGGDKRLLVHGVRIWKNYNNELNSENAGRTSGRGQEEK